MAQDLKIIFICVLLFAFFCLIVALVESHKARIHRRARKIYGKIKRREEATSVKDIKNHNFRSTRWGMDQTAVKQSEENEDLEFEGTVSESPIPEVLLGGNTPAEEALVFSTQAFKFPCHLAYYFKNGRLSSARCCFDVHYENVNTYMDMFNKLIKRLMRVYGLPANRDIFWTEEASQLNLPFTMQAVAAGQAVYVAHWKTKRSVIFARLTKGPECIEMTLQIFEVSAL